MRRIGFAVAFAVVLFLLASPVADGQAGRKVQRIGVIYTSAPDQVEHLNRALGDGLRELGYVEQRDLVFERRYAEGRPERLPVLAAELVRVNVDVVVTGSNPVIAAVKKATPTIPVVMAVSRDPVAAGFINSLSRPGGNITGLANDPAPEIQAKNLELLKQAAPRVARVALLWNPDPGMDTYRNAVAAAGRKLGVASVAAEIHGRQELESAIATMLREHVDGVVALQDPVLYSLKSELVRFVGKQRWPAVYSSSEFVEIGGLMSYGVNLAQQFRRAASYVDKVLKGAKPADLPVEQPTKFELVINLKTAKALGLTIPQSLLVRADEIIQ